MVRIAARQFNEFRDRVLDSTDPVARGRALEDLVCYLIDTVPGVEVTERNRLNPAHSQEIDIAAWNDQAPNGFWFLPPILLFECKNWTRPVGSNEVAWFDAKVRSRGLDLGILVAAQGVTGDAERRTAAHAQIAAALHESRRLVVISLEELAPLRDSRELVALLKRKLTSLAARGTSIA